jgi:hypothetical protein
MTNQKETKHTKHDESRKDLPRLPSSRIKDSNKAKIMEQLYLLIDKDSKLDLIVSAAKFAIHNKDDFIKFSKENK